MELAVMVEAVQDGSGTYNDASYPGGTGGTSNSGGTTGNTNWGTNGTFGVGGRKWSNGNTASGAGGGGWYGGGSGTALGAGGGGGSGYVYTSSTASQYPSGCLLNSSYYLTNASTTGNNRSGNGYARITLAE